MNFGSSFQLSGLVLDGQAQGSASCEDASRFDSSGQNFGRARSPRRLLPTPSRLVRQQPPGMRQVKVR
jgi:hypothetical protein